MKEKEAYFTLFNSDDNIIDRFVITNNPDYYSGGAYVVSDSGYYLFARRYFPIIPIKLESVALFVVKTTPLFGFILADDGINSLTISFIDDTIKLETRQTNTTFELNPNDSLDLLYFLNKILPVIYKENGLGL